MAFPPLLSHRPRTGDLKMTIRNTDTVSSIVADMNTNAVPRDEVMTLLTENLLTDSEKLLYLGEIEVINLVDLKEILDAQRALAEKAASAAKLREKGKLPPFTTAEWLEKAPSFVIPFGETKLDVKPKAFKTGSYGSYGSGVTTILIDGHEVACRVSVNLTVSNSKHTSS